MLEIIDDPKYVQAVKKSIETSFYYNHLKEVFDLLKDYTLYFWGGAVRYPVLPILIPDHKFNKNNEKVDFDILIDDSNKRLDSKKIDEYFKKSLSYGEFKKTMFSNTKWVPEPGVEIDIVPLSDTSTLRNERNIPQTLETVIEHCDLNTGAIAYNIRNPIIYSYGAIEAFKKKEVEINNVDYLDPYITCTRLILQANKLCFILGEKAQSFIAERYLPEWNRNIKNYLEKRDLSKHYNLVIKSLNKIQQSTKQA